LSPTADDLLLKVSPPRSSRNLLPRRHLRLDDARHRDAAVLLVQAPPGYGKTSLLAQWRRERLAHGVVVAWLLAQPHDDVPRLVQGLTLSVRQAAGRPGFGQTLLDGTPPKGLAGVTAWLAELAQAALDVVLFVDEADRLGAEAREALAYLLRNAPPNLRAVIAARAGADLGIADLIDYGHCVVVGAAALRFELGESIELARVRLGAATDADTVARLHELVEGWPLGLQLALGAAAGHDLRQVVAALAAPGDRAREQLVELLLARIDRDDLALLTRIAILDPLHPALVTAVAGADDVPARLARLVRDTALFSVAEHGEWLRLHALAREALRVRFDALPEDERRTLHRRACDWLESRGDFEAAAEHALASAQPERAYDLAERGLYGSLMSGHRARVLGWLERLPDAQLHGRPRLLLAIAWSLALGNRHEEAGRWVARLQTQPGTDPGTRCECDLILSGAAVFADDPDRFAALHDPWADDPPLVDPMLRQVHANRSAYRALLEGEPALARRRQQQLAPRDSSAPALAHMHRWGDFVVGLSYLWEGQVLLAERSLRPALAGAEDSLGRRDVFASMLAVLLAAAVFERNQPDEAQALLANRLDVIERDGLPETVLLGYRTLARTAAAGGAEHRALDLLGAMDAVGRGRGLPRLCVASLADQVRLHARRYRSETCRDLAARIDRLLDEPGLPVGRLWRRSVTVLRELAHGYAAVAARDWRRAIEAIARADALALELRLGRLHIELLGLSAWALDRCGERSAPLLHEAADLAAAHGLLRVFDDAHPDLGEWARGLTPVRSAPAAQASPRREPAPPRAAPSTALTPKEREVLELLARNLSNKEIGLAMQVGEETIKWHVKNLFAKLDAGTRKQVVQRARILGLLEA
jgi:LuxR family maltose regulon positive regulatory protein